MDEIGYPENYLSDRQSRNERFSNIVRFTGGALSTGAYNYFVSPQKKYKADTGEGEITSDRPSYYNKKLKYDDEQVVSYQPSFKRYKQQSEEMAKGKSYYKKKYKRKYKGRYQKKYGGRMKITGSNLPAKVQRSMVESGCGFPKMMKMAHKFTTVVTLTGTAGALGVYNFVANGLYRPDPLGTTAPLYYATMAAIYDHHSVIASKIRIVAIGTAGTITSWGCFINDDGTVTPTTAEQCKQQTSGTWKIWTAAASANENMITKSYATKKVFGGSVLSNDNLQGALAANPVETSLYTVWIQNSEATPVTSTFRIAVEIDYIAIWKEVRDVAV